MSLLRKTTSLIRGGKIQNIGLQKRVREYLRLERALASKFGCQDLTGNREYDIEAGVVADMWISLIVDVSLLIGGGLDEDVVDAIDIAIHDSISDSVSEEDCAELSIKEISDLRQSYYEQSLVVEGIARYAM